VTGHNGLVGFSDRAEVAQLDLSDPAYPIVLGTINVPQRGSRVAITGNLGHSASPHAGLDVISLCESPGYDHIAWLEIAAHNNGLKGSQWRTDAIVRNLGAATTELVIVLNSGGDEHVLSSTIEPGAQAVFEDIVGLMDVVGKGALEIRATEPIATIGRIYDLTENGTYGQVLHGRQPQHGLSSRETAWLYGLRQVEEQYRTNLSFTNTGLSTARVWITLYATDGSELASYWLRDVPPRQVVQDIEPLANRAGQPNVGWAMAEVYVYTGRGVFASASVIDSRTNDPITIPMMR
jgi:hypothetical protein